MMKRMMAVAAVAALILVGSTRPADAHVSIGIGIPLPGVVVGAPAYYGPSYYGPAYYGPSYYYGGPVVGGVFFGGHGGHHGHWGGGRHWSGGHRH